jgi:hypothetical protein
MDPRLATVGRQHAGAHREQQVHVYAGVISVARRTKGTATG